MSKYKQGFFKCQNPEKYDGDPTQIVYRSSWEFRLMLNLDQRNDVISWASEPFPIPYISSADQKIHRYYVDFKVKTKDKKFLIEIKPESQVKPPIKPEKINKRFINEVLTWQKNQDKWKFAKEYAEKNGYIFQIMTEKDLNIKS